MYLYMICGFNFAGVEFTVRELTAIYLPVSSTAFGSAKTPDPAISPTINTAVVGIVRPPDPCICHIKPNLQLDLMLKFPYTHLCNLIILIKAPKNYHRPFLLPKIDNISIAKLSSFRLHFWG